MSAPPNHFDAASAEEDVSNKMTTLNVNATEFKPSWLAAASEPAAQPGITIVEINVTPHCD